MHLRSEIAQQFLIIAVEGLRIEFGLDEAVALRIGREVQLEVGKRCVVRAAACVQVSLPFHDQLVRRAIAKIVRILPVIVE